MAGAAYALHRRRDRSRRAHLAHQVDGADIDSQLQGRGRDQQPDLSILELAFSLQAKFPGEASVVSGHILRPQALAQSEGHPLHHAAGIDKDQRRPVLQGQLGQPRINIVPDGVGSHRPQLLPRHFHGQVERAMPSHLHNGYLRRALSGQESGDEFNGVLGGGESDTQRRLRSPGDQGARTQAVFAADQRVETLQSERQVGTALVVRDGVDLIDDHRLHVAEIVPALLRRQQNVERLRRSHKNVRRPF